MEVRPVEPRVRPDRAGWRACAFACLSVPPWPEGKSIAWIASKETGYAASSSSVKGRGLNDARNAPAWQMGRSDMDERGERPLRAPPEGG